MEGIQGSYLYLFISSGFGADDPVAVLTLFMLFLARIFPIIAQAPFFGAKVLPHSVKVMLGLSLFAIFLPHLLFVTEHRVGYNAWSFLLLCKELFVGVLLGFLISLPFSIVQSTGLIIDHQRGGASLMVNDPTMQNQSSPFGTFFNMVLIYLFFVIDGPFLFLNAIMESYTVIPPDRFINPDFFERASTSWDMMVQVFNKVMLISMQLATPALLAILMTDVFLGIANRLAPQVQITFLGMPLKSLLAILIVCFGWRLLTEEMVKQSRYWLDSIANVLLMLSPS